MQKSYRFLLSALVLGAFLLSACSGAVPQQDDSPGGSAGTSSEVVFTGTVQSMGGAQWLISGQSVEVDSSTAVDSSIQVGDIVRVEANVSQEGAVLAMKIESSSPGDDSNANDANSNDDNANTNGDDGNANENTNGVDDNSNANTNANSNDVMSGSEIFGLVESITADSITIGGVTYTIASFTEFKDIISLGDQVKIHVIVNADGTLTIREIEKSSGSDDDNSNINGNTNDDDGSNGNSNDDNSNDDDDDDNSNSNSNDNNDDDDDDNSNDNDN